MTWLLIPFRILSAGLLRFADGSSLDFPRVITTILIGLTSLWAAYDASTDWIVSVVVGVISAGTIQMGDTDWENLRHQLIRGFWPCALMLIVLISLDWQLAKLSLLGMLTLHMFAFGIYWLEGKVKPTLYWPWRINSKWVVKSYVLCEMEQVNRVIQGSAICLAATLV